jgi:hypothetical protein
MNDSTRLGPWAAAVGSGIVVAIASNYINGGNQTRDQLVQVSIQLAKTNETLSMVCKQLEEKVAVDKRQDAELEQLRLRLERHRIR